MANTHLLNINSSLFQESTLMVELNQISQLDAEIDAITNKIWQRPIFMVNEELMDVLCPTELMRYYDPEDVKRKIHNYTSRNRMDNAFGKDHFFPWKEIFGEGITVPAEGDIPLYFQNFWAVYLHKLSVVKIDEILKILKKIRNKNLMYYDDIIEFFEDIVNRKKSEPFIFICPERMQPFAKKLGSSGASVFHYERNFKLVLKYICFKCVCFHYFHPNINNSDIWTRLVSHSLATFFSLRSLEESESKVASMFLNRGSVEDRIYECWEKLTPSKITREINIWLIKWRLGQPAISTTHDSQIYSKLHKSATKLSLRPTLNSDEYSFEFMEQYESYLSINHEILNNGSQFWEKIAWNLLLSWSNLSK